MFGVIRHLTDDGLSLITISSQRVRHYSPNT